MNDPRVETDGESWVYAWEEYGVSIGFEALRDRSDGLHGELWVMGDPHANAHGPHISWGSFNLSSPTIRSREAKLLHSKPGGGHVSEPAWAAMLERACVSTAMEFRKGESAVNLSEGEPLLDAPFLVRPISPEGQPTIFFADGESSKGWIALAMCLALRLGGEVIPGFVPTRQCNCIYLDWETDAASNRRRLAYICRGIGLHARPEIYYRRLHRPLADELTSVRELIRKTHAEFLVVDSIGLAAAGDIKESDPAMRFMAAVRHLDITSLLLGHVSKATAAQTGSTAGRVIGSTFYQLLARSAWELKADADMQPIVVGFYHRKSNLGPRQPSFALRLTFEDAPNYRLRFERCSLEASPVVADKLPLPQRMMAALRRGSRSTSELAEELNVSQAQVRTAARRLEGVSPAKVVQLTSRAGKGGKGRESVWGLSAFADRREPGTTA